MSHSQENSSDVVVLTFEGDELQELKDELGSAITQEHGAAALAALEVASDHPYTCRCRVCLQWWAHCGPEWEDEDVPAGYGPFTKDEVNAEQRRLGIEVTP